MVEDAVLAVSIRHGLSVDAVMDMDLLSFDALVLAGVRAQAYRDIQDAWTAMIAAQGEAKNMKKWTRELAERAKISGVDDAVQKNLEAIKKAGGKVSL